MDNLKQKTMNKLFLFLSFFFFIGSINAQTAPIKKKTYVDEQKILNVEAATPRAGYISAPYRKADGNWYEKTDAGVEQIIIDTVAMLATKYDLQNVSVDTLNEIATKYDLSNISIDTVLEIATKYDLDTFDKSIITDGTTITGNGTLGNELTLDTTNLIATKTDLSNLTGSSVDTISEIATKYDLTQILGVGIDTLNNYNELISYVGTSKVVLITGTGKGLFYRTQNGTHNRITIIESTNGVKWERLIDGKNYYDSWVEIDVVEYGLGTVGVAKDNWDALQNISELTPVGGNIIMTPNTKYFYDKVIDVGGKNLISSNDTIATPDQISSFPNASYNAVTSITVTDGSEFYIGAKVGIANSSGTSNNDLIAFSSGAKTAKVTNVVGNVITFEYNVGSIDASDLVFVSSDAIQAQTSPLILDGIVFEGNLNNNGANYGWELGAMIRSNKPVNITNCHFNNTVSNVFAPSGYIGFCKVDSSASGSLLHISSGEITTLNERTSFTIENNEGREMGLHVLDAIHNQNFVEYSSYVYDININNNKLRDSGGGFVGPFSFDDWKLSIKDNQVYNANTQLTNCLEFNTITGTAYSSDIEIVGNKFIDSGNIDIRGTTYSAGRGIYRFTFKENTIKNGIIFIQSMYGGEFSGNLIFADTNFVFADRQISGQTNILDHSLILMRSSAEVIFKDNQIFTTELQGNNAYQAIATAGCDNLTFSGNIIKGFQIGINTYNNSLEGGTPHKIIFFGNQIESIDDPNCTDETIATCIKAAKGNSLINNTLITDQNGGIGRPLTLHITSNTNKGITTIMGNGMYTTNASATRFPIGGGDNDELFIVNNYGVCGDPSVLIHPDYSGGINSTISNNLASDSDNVDIPFIDLPIYLNFLNE